MHLFSPNKRIVKYDSVSQIVDEFYEERIKGYQKRKRYLISKFKKERDLLDNQVRFIQEVMDGRFKMVQSKGEWVSLLRNRGYTRFQELNKIESTKNKEEDEN
jgi:DNA topoisomerase II